MKYALEVHEPDDSETVAFHVESQTPFSSISVGDLLHHMRMPISARLKVTQVEHLFWETEANKTQKTCIHTVAADF